MAELCITDADVVDPDDVVGVLSVMPIVRVAAHPRSLSRQDYVEIDLGDDENRVFYRASKEHVRQLAETFARLYKDWDKT